MRTRVDLSLERQPQREASNWLSAAAAADGWSKLIGIRILACSLSLLRVLCAARGCAIDALARLVRLHRGLGQFTPAIAGKSGLVSGAVRRKLGRADRNTRQLSCSASIKAAEFKGAKKMKNCHAPEE